MLDEKRIREAQSNVNDYLREGLIKKTIVDHNIGRILINNSKESLKVAEIIFSNNYSNLWAIVCSYYAMYYVAKAVLYSMSYKIGHKISHKVTADALIVYVRDKLKKSLIDYYEEAQEEALEIAGVKADELISEFDDERGKRSRVQYRMTEPVIREKAKISLERAKKFVFEIEKLLE